MRVLHQGGCCHVPLEWCRQSLRCVQSTRVTLLLQRCLRAFALLSVVVLKGLVQAVLLTDHMRHVVFLIKVRILQ